VSRYTGNAATPWLASMLSSAVIVLFIELNKHHYAAHDTNGRIGGGILIWVLFTLAIRLLLFVVTRFRRM